MQVSHPNPTHVGIYWSVVRMQRKLSTSQLFCCEMKCYKKRPTIPTAADSSYWFTPSPHDHEKCTASEFDFDKILLT